jgi:2-isopropylmalate synthase
MPGTDDSPAAGPWLQTPSGPAREGQPRWNPQRGSSMPTGRYGHSGPRLAETPIRRSWPDREVSYAPLWCSVDLRDGNQALPNPMDPLRKEQIFDLLVEMGFKEIEVGYPSSSEADFEFVRRLIREDRVPDDVTISVFTPARLDLIDRTFESIRGTDRAMVHLCLATACLWREVVFKMSALELQRLTIESAEHVARLADAASASRLRFEYSPETFNVTEPGFALAVCDAVASAWDASPDRPVTINLPSTVETDSANVYADQIEWMHRNLANRESIILSVHPHNDRGTAVASAELALMAGADRVEGTLFGNGERTGNVCLATVALNLFSRGVDPQLDFSNIDAVRRTVEFCNQMPVHTRHPYVGDLVYTAFSGTHQDAIAKGMIALHNKAATTGQPVSSLPWEVPYLPIDPRDVGRTYDSVVRVNSQSGKGGIAHMLRDTRGFDLPRAMRMEFAKTIQKITDKSGNEVNSQQLWDIFKREYLTPYGQLMVKEFREHEHEDADQVRLETVLITRDGNHNQLSATAATVGAAYAEILAAAGHPVELEDVTLHPIGDQTAAYAYVTLHGSSTYGAGLADTPTEAVLGALTSAANRLLASSAFASHQRLPPDGHILFSEGLPT